MICWLGLRCLALLLLLDRPKIAAQTPSDDQRELHAQQHLYSLIVFGWAGANLGVCVVDGQCFALHRTWLCLDLCTRVSKGT